MTFPHQDQLAWKISITFVHCLSLSMTLIRLNHRWRTSRIWWDDYVVVIPWVFDLFSTIILWTEYTNKGIISKAADFLYSGWFDTFRYFTVIWFSHISLTLSVARVFLPGHRYRLWSFIFVVVLLLLYLLSIFLGTFLCQGSPWWTVDLKHCFALSNGQLVSATVAIADDFAADVVLVIAPLLMFWKVKFPKPSDRILILVLFSSSVLTIVALGLFCAAWFGAASIGPDASLILQMAAHLHQTMALLVTNLQIVSMMVYRKFRGSNNQLQNRRPRDRPSNTDAGNTTRERRQSIIDYPTTLPSYTVTIASLAVPTSTSSEQNGPTSVPQSTSTSSGVPSSQLVSTSVPQSTSASSSVPSSQPISTSGFMSVSQSTSTSSSVPSSQPISTVSERSSTSVITPTSNS